MSRNKNNNQQYLLHEEKVIQITKAIAKDRIQRARIMRDISIAFFGFRRYKYVTLQCSFNNFKASLEIANIMHNRIQKLALIIKFKEEQYWKCEIGTDKMDKQKQSLFLIKLTLQPTQDDKKQPGFNPGLEVIQKPLKSIMRMNNNQKAKNQKQSNKKSGKKQKENQKKQPTQKKYRREKSYDARSKSPQYQRGQRKTRGQSKTTGNVAKHDYKQEHLNREVQNNQRQQYDRSNMFKQNSKTRENRGDRRPRRDNRYED